MSTDIDKCGGEVGSRMSEEPDGMEEILSVSPVMSADGVPMPSPCCTNGLKRSADLEQFDQ